MFGACLDPGFVDARVGFLKNRGNRDCLLWGSKEKRELDWNRACWLHSACGLEQGEDVSVGVLENCKVSHGWDFLFCSDHLGA